MLVSAREAYRVWASSYDEKPNPLLALEMRMLRDRIGPLRGRRLLDVATGTGRWMRFAASEGACAFGVDLSAAMAGVAARHGLAGRLALADIDSLPFADDAADIAICSFALGYLASVDRAIGEMARVAGTVVVSDLHAGAAAAGWSRSFRAQGRVYEIEHYLHSVEALDRAASAAGLVHNWELQAHFGEPERAVFATAGRGETFDKVSGIPAVYARCWSRQ